MASGSVGHGSSGRWVIFLENWTAKSYVLTKWHADEYGCGWRRNIGRWANNCNPRNGAN